MGSPGPVPRKAGYVQSVLREIGGTLARRPNLRPSDRRIFASLLVTFVIVFSLLGVTFYLFANQLRAPATAPIGFTTPVMAAGNATFRVSRVDGGPYAATGFAVDLTVNDFRGLPTPLAASNESASIPIGTNVYRITWTDSDGHGTVSVGDAFRLTGDGVPLPPLSTITLALAWPGGWSAPVSWATSSE